MGVMVAGTNTAKAAALALRLHGHALKRALIDTEQSRYKMRYL